MAPGDAAIDRFITPTPPPERVRDIDPSRGNHDGNANVTGSAEDFGAFESSPSADGNVATLNSREVGMRSEVAADYEKVAEARKKMEFSNADELAATASRMLTAVMGGRETAIADKELFWKVANAYFSKNDEKFDLEKVSRVYMNARTARLTVDGINDEVFTGLVDLTNKQLTGESKNPLRSKEGHFQNFIQRRSIRTSSREFKENYGRWFDVRDKSTFKNLTSEMVTGSLQDYQREASQADAEILESLRGQDQPIVAEAAVATPTADVTREVVQAEDVLETAIADFELGALRQKIVLDAAEIEAQGRLLKEQEARISSLEKAVKLSAEYLGDKTIQEILTALARGKFLTGPEQTYLQQQATKNPFISVLWGVYQAT